MFEVYDNTMLSDYKRCPRYYYHKQKEHLVPNVNNDIAIKFGEAWHLALDAFYSNESSDDAFIKSFLPHEGKCEKGIRTLGNGLFWLDCYKKMYPMKEMPFTCLHVETAFKVPLFNFYYCGKVDKIVRYNFPSNNLVIIDHKSSMRKGFLTLNPNSALTGYLYGVSKVLNKPVLTACLDQMYMRKGKEPLLIREFTERTEKQIDEWKENTKKWVALIRMGFFQQNENNCTAFNRGCEYKMLCNCKDKGSLKGLKEDCYKKEIWNPLEGKLL